MPKSNFWCAQPIAIKIAVSDHIGTSDWTHPFVVCRDRFFTIIPGGFSQRFGAKLRSRTLKLALEQVKNLKCNHAPKTQAIDLKIAVHMRIGVLHNSYLTNMLCIIVFLVPSPFSRVFWHSLGPPHPFTSRQKSVFGRFLDKYLSAMIFFCFARIYDIWRIQSNHSWPP